jgi:hypothetical protein
MRSALRTKIGPGSFGGLCTEVIRLYRIHILGSMQPVAGSSHYWWVSVLFIICAGVLAHYWDDDTPIRSFYVGLSLPALVSAFAH